MASLTDIAIKSLKPPAQGQKLYYDDTFKGFCLRVSQGGSKTFLLVKGKRGEKITLGRYGIITLSEARSKARAILAEKTLGHYQQKTISFAAVRDLFVAHSEKKNRPRTAAEYKWLLNRLSFDTLHIRPRDIAKELNCFTSPSEQNHLLTALKALLTFAVNQGYLNTNPALSMPLPSKRTPRARTLSKDELKPLWLATRASTRPFHRIVRLCMLTGQRRGEIAYLRGEYIDREAKTITLPSTLTKNHKEHTIPYGPLTAEILDALPDTGYLFPASKGDGVFNAWGKEKTKLDTASGVTNWTLHDLRRTYATIHAELNTPIHIIEKLLNHVSGTFSGVAGIYNRHAYFEEMKLTVQAYEKHIAFICRG